MTAVVGIDPGITGALALHFDGKLVTAIDMPVYDGRTDGAALHDIFIDWSPDVIYVEQSQPMPRNGVIATFSLGFNTGVIVGVIQSLRYPFVRVKPSTWKKQMSVTRKDKNAIRGIVRELYPEHAASFRRVMDHNRAEAVLISRYGVGAQLQERNAS